MLKDLLRRAFGSRSSAPADSVSQPSERQSGQLEDPSAYARHSHGLEQFLANLASEEPLQVLDLGGVTQANVAYLTGLGHKLYSEELLRSVDRSAPADDAGQQEIESFLDQALGYPEASFDGVLVWDALEFVPPILLKPMVRRLQYVSKPGAYLLTLFHADERAELVPTYSYRILDGKTLMLARRQMRRPLQLFNNRAVERLFQDFQSVKFFLARDHLREVIVRR